MPHLHLWETKFYRRRKSLRVALEECRRDSRRITLFQSNLQSVLSITGEVVWIDPYSKHDDSSWRETVDVIQEWNLHNRVAPIRLWAFSPAGEVHTAGFDLDEARLHGGLVNGEDTGETPDAEPSAVVTS